MELGDVQINANKGEIVGEKMLVNVVATIKM